MRFFFLFFLAFIAQQSFSQSSIQLSATDSPKVFGPGIISDGFSNRDMAISPDGNDLFYTLQWTNGLFSLILHSKKSNGEWTKPETAWFSGRFNDLEPAFSPDGNELFFTSNRPLGRNDSSRKDYDIWYLKKKGDSWEGPFNSGPVINTGSDEFYPSLAKNGDLYFTRDNGEEKDDIFLSVFKDGKYETPHPLPPSINSKGYDFNAFIDPDENYIIFSSYKRADDLGGGDLYFCLRKAGEWQPANHFGPEINSPALDYSPFVSWDHQYFFFTSKKQLVKFPFQQPKTIGEIREILQSYGNGNDDIYIMNFKKVEQMMGKKFGRQ
jgi:Tol biopolymer transport system component